MTREELVLASLAAAGENASFSPVQVQKLLFLIDREAAEHVSGPHFSFKPYDYGPFDRAEYEVLDLLEIKRLIRAYHNGRYQLYALTEEGFEHGSATLQRTSAPARSYIEQAAEWVRGLSFSQLVAAIYSRYPDMKVNSVFRT
jgi:hypothetical protein